MGGGGGGGRGEEREEEERRRRRGALTVTTSLSMASASRDPALMAGHTDLHLCVDLKKQPVTASALAHVHDVMNTTRIDPKVPSPLARRHVEN